MITHIVTFKMRDASPDHIAKCKALIESMNGAVPSLRSLEVGVNVVDTVMAHHFALVATFDDREGLQEYQDHPAHVEVAGYLRANRETGASVDYEH